jgi:thioredoxin-dependent peroxiredoxin
MSVLLGDMAPDFEAETTEGRIHFHDWIGDSWAVLFSHPKDFTPVCTTELGYMAKIQPAFELRNVKVIGLSVDSAQDHQAWAKDIEETQGYAPNYPIISDADFHVSKLYGMLPAETSGDPGGRTPADNQTVRNVFVIGPDKKVKLILVYPMTTGRNFDEVLRVIDSLQLTAKHKVATPVNWKQGEDVIHRRVRLRRGSLAEVPGRLEDAAAVHPYRPPAQMTWAGRQLTSQMSLPASRAPRSPGPLRARAAVIWSAMSSS